MTQYQHGSTLQAREPSFGGPGWYHGSAAFSQALKGTRTLVQRGRKDQGLSSAADPRTTLHAHTRTENAFHSPLTIAAELPSPVEHLGSSVADTGAG